MLTDGAYWDTNPEPLGRRLELLVELGKTKLRTFSVKDSIGRQIEGLFAAVCCRLALGFSRASNSANLVNDLVASGMAQAAYVPQSRSYVFAGYPAEPLLARAAYDIMSQGTRADFLDVLITLTDNCMIDCGPKGELISKFLIISTYDRCALQVQPASSFPDDGPEGPSVFPPVTLLSFILGLCDKIDIQIDNQIGDLSNVEAFTTSKPTNKPEKLSDYGHYTTVCGQFITATDLDPRATSQKKAHYTATLPNQALLIQGMIQCSPNNPLVDFWQVFAHNEDRLAIGWRIRNREAAWDESKLSPDTFEHLRTAGIPVLYIVHDIMASEGTSSARLRKISRPVQSAKQANWAPLFCLVLTGLPSDAVCDGKLSQLLRSQTRPFQDSGNVSEDQILQMGLALTSRYSELQQMRSDRNVP